MRINVNPLQFPIIRSIFSLGSLPRDSRSYEKKNRALYPFILVSVSTSWPQGLRKAQLAGSWYPKDPEALAKLVDYFLKNVPASPLSSDDIMAIIAPHAGYVYSGQVAAYAYKPIQNKNCTSVVILAPSHQFGFEGCSIYPS